MWRVCSKTIFPRWQSVRQGASSLQNANKKKDGKHQASFAAIPNSQRQSHDDDKKKQYANRQHRCWEDPQYHFDVLCNNLMTIGWVGVTALCLDLPHRFSIKSVFDRRIKKCPFSKRAYAMLDSPQNVILAEEKSCDSTDVPENIIAVIEPVHPECPKFVAKPLQPECLPSTSSEELVDINSIMKDFKKMTIDSISAMENEIGVILAKQDEKEAFTFFRGSAKLGCSKGLFNLGMCYENGRGTNVDLKKAAHCYQKAAENGHSLALYNIAVFTLKGLGGIPVDFEKGIDMLKDAAELGVPQAQVCLGFHYLEEKKWSEAFRLFREASSKDVNGKYYLGQCYENGWGVAQNETVAAELYAQASKAGHEDATLKLGMIYEHGCEGIDADVDFSMTLYKMLAEKGHFGGTKAMEVLKEKQKPKIKVKRENVETIENAKPIGSIHTSASLPELLNYALENNFIVSKSSSIETMYSQKVAIQSQNPIKPDSATEMNCSLDLASYSFQRSLPHIVAANS